MAHKQGPTKHWNCTGCKEDQGRYGRRTKYGGGVFCDSCLSRISYGGRRVGGGFFGFFRGIWDFLVDIIQAPFQIKQRRKAEANTMKVQASVMKMKAREIPGNPATGAPQKR